MVWIFIVSLVAVSCCVYGFVSSWKDMWDEVEKVERLKKERGHDMV